MKKAILTGIIIGILVTILIWVLWGIYYFWGYRKQMQQKYETIYTSDDHENK